MSKILFGVTFPNSNKELFEPGKTYTYETEELAKRNSMNFTFCRAPQSDDIFPFAYFYRGQQVQIAFIDTNYRIQS